MAERAHLSIGEVLSLLREEFPDVTISKIRFLESQGLVDPERTPSGYRKFYDHDVERLRWILRQQREHFLPLKVIRGRLSESSETSDGGEAVLELRPGVPESPVPVGASERSGAVAAAVATDVGDALTARAPSPQAGRVRPTRDEDLADHSSRTYTVEELAAAVGATPQLIEDLAQYGLLRTEARTGGTHYYGEDALAVADTARRFAEHGVEPRHLRAWRTSADREAGLFEQVVMPLLRQRNPQAREQVVLALEDLDELGAQLRSALVRQALRDIRF
ncbi:MAG: MerR family transcriptional regulator [Acidimicrobiaceae bacterium]|nr:MerR family transcriptional regulator [Acidimicrobiaceae bacterium]